MGIRKGVQSTNSFHSIDDIIAGKFPNYPIWKLKKRLLLSGYMEEKCANCGFEERKPKANQLKRESYVESVSCVNTWKESR